MLAVDRPLLAAAPVPGRAQGDTERALKLENCHKPGWGAGPASRAETFAACTGLAVCCVLLSRVQILGGARRVETLGADPCPVDEEPGGPGPPPHPWVL